MGATGAEGEDEPEVASLAIFIQAALLASVLAFGHCLARWKISWIGDAGIALALEFFFIALLPPIIFQAGYSLNAESFFGNCGAIASYAFVGTFSSTLVIGLVMWLGGLAGACVQLSFLETLLFGAIVSATDPVTVLAVFERLHAEENLYALVFGESVLNDAVAIVLFRVLAGFLNAPVTAGAIFKAVGLFLLIFLGSMAIGVVMGAYTRPNMTKTSRDRTGAFFRILATLSETFVFLYIGASLFIQQQGWEHGRIFSFVVVSLVALAISRTHVWPLSALINYLRPVEMKIQQSQQFMLWWSGLRGAMAFALALQAADELPGGHGELMLTVVYFLIVITVLINGGACAFLLTKLNLRAAEEGLQSSFSSPGSYQQLVVSDDDGEGGASLGVADGAVIAHVTVIPELPSKDAAKVERNPWDVPEAQVEGQLIKHPPGSASSRLERLREANKRGLMSQLTKLDEKYLGKMFLAEQRELLEMAPPGDLEATEGHK
ncbi:hypothetical protein N2152v2_011242 [Parachlorella kessleri]